MSFQRGVVSFGSTVYSHIVYSLFCFFLHNCGHVTSDKPFPAIFFLSIFSFDIIIIINIIIIFQNHILKIAH